MSIMRAKMTPQACSLVKLGRLGRVCMVCSIGGEFENNGDDNVVENGELKKTKAKKQKVVPISALTEDTAKIELMELNKKINFYDSLYYSSLEEEKDVIEKDGSDDLDYEAISDRAYDKLVSRADAISGRFGHLRDIVDKFNRIGYSRSSKFEPFSHLGGNMLSLDNAFSDRQIRSFVDRCSIKLGVDQEEGTMPLRVVVEPKIDGLSLALHYVDGKLVGAGTRGDGVVGENVTANVQYIDDIPKVLPDSVSVEVRGEVYITKHDFAELNRERLSRNETKLSTTRNAASGGLRQIDPQLTAERKLRFFAYSLFGIEHREDRMGAGFTSVGRHDQFESLEELRRLGFGVATPVKSCASVEEAIEHCMHLEDIRGVMGFDIDGAVLKVDSLESQNRIGELSRFPGWAIAYKFKAEQGITVLKDIEVQVGRTGVLTPVAILEPVKIGGVVIERATLHNEAEVRRHKLCPGATVTVIRAGDVIPKVIGRLDVDHTDPHTSEAAGTDGGGTYSLPTSCPVCGSPTEKDGDILVRCTGTTVCSAQAVSQISHFCSRDAADIDGLGPARIEELHQLGMLRSIADIYSLRKVDLGDVASLSKAERKSLRDLKGWGDRSVNNLLAAIDARKNLTFDRFLYGLGIRHVGLGIARDIAKEFGDFGDFWQYIKSASDINNENGAKGESEDENGKKKVVEEHCSRLHTMPGIGPKVTLSLLNYASTPATRSLVDGLLNDIEVLPSASANAALSTGSTDNDVSIIEGNLSNEIFLFTGKLESLTRTEATDLCTSLGAKVRTSFTQDVTVLVNGGDTTRESSKMKKAGESDKVRVVDEENFLKMVKKQ